MTATGQAIASNTPSAVATPLPPRKPSHTGNMWPRMTAPAAASIASPPQMLPINTAATPFARSSSSVSAATALLPVRSTFVAPMLPDPIPRMSPSPATRVSTMPNGIDPSRYPITAARTIPVITLPLPDEDRAAVDDRLHGVALHRAAVERRVLRFRTKALGVDPPGHVGIEQHQIGRAARHKPPDIESENARRVDRQPAQHLDEFEMAVVIQLERQGQQCLQPDDAARRRAEWQAF